MSKLPKSTMGRVVYWGVSTQKKEKLQIKVFSTFPTIRLRHHYLQWTGAIITDTSNNVRQHCLIHFYAFVNCGTTFPKTAICCHILLNMTWKSVKWACNMSTWLKQLHSFDNLNRDFSMLNSRVTCQVCRLDWSTFRREEDMCTANAIYHFYKFCNFLPLHSQGQVTV